MKISSEKSKTTAFFGYELVSIKIDVQVIERIKNFSYLACETHVSGITGIIVRAKSISLAFFVE